MKLISLDKDYSIKLNSQVTNYLNPDFIYVPIKNNPVTFKKNSKIKKGDLIFNQYYASISGRVIAIKKCIMWDKSSEKCLIIANDFQEKLASRIATRKKINNLTIEEIKQDLKDISEDKLFKSLDIKHIIICGIDDEPYIANEVFIQKENTKIILETIDVLLNIFPGSTAHVCIKNIDSENIMTYTNFLGTYTNIELNLVEDLYLIGQEQNLIQKLNIKDSYLYLKTSEVFALYNNIKKRKPLFETFITITGDALKNPQVINTKLGVKVLDIINTYYKLDINNYDVYVNGLMQGTKMNIADLIVTKELKGLIIMNKSKNKTKNCINCGKCIEICPINSNPLLAYKKGIKVKCINCGLCTYICPAYINLKNYLVGDSNE